MVKTGFLDIYYETKALQLSGTRILKNLHIKKVTNFISIEILEKLHFLLEFSSKKAENWCNIYLHHILKTLCRNFEHVDCFCRNLEVRYPIFAFLLLLFLDFEP